MEINRSWIEYRINQSNTQTYSVEVSVTWYPCHVSF